MFRGFRALGRGGGLDDSVPHRPNQPSTSHTAKRRLHAHLSGRLPRKAEAPAQLSSREPKQLEQACPNSWRLAI